MDAAVLKRPWVFGLVYVALSLAVEAALIVIAGLRVPEDNKILAPVVLTLPPLLAAWIAGYRRPGDFFTIALLASVLTLVITIVFGRITGISTGMAEPIVNRFLAGLLAAWLANRFAARRRPPL